MVRDVGVVDDVFHVDEDLLGDIGGGWDKINNVPALNVPALKLIGGVVYIQCRKW